MGFKGLFVGLCTIDSQFLVNKFPSSNSKVKASDYGIYTGGPATNAAITFSFLGGKSHLVSSIGKHLFHNFILDELKTFNLKITDITPHSHTNPTLATVITTKRNGARAVISYNPKDIRTSTSILNSFNILNFNIVLVDGFHMEYCIKISSLANKNNIPVIFDGGSWKEGMGDLLNNIDIAICSENFSPPGIKSKKKVIKFLRKKEVNSVAITRGHKPIMIYEKNKLSKIRVSKIEVVDTLGAGDIFHGAFCYYYLKSNDFKNAIKEAVDIAAKSCLSFGTREWMKK